MPDVDVWPQIKRELDHLWSLAQPERLAYLADLTQREPALAQQVQQWDQAQTPSILNLQVSGRREHIAQGTYIGEYRIQALIAHGGMGSVYRARHPVLQDVAVKVMRPELRFTSFLARFQQERDILASLRHPYIAHLLDAGTTATGLPFVAMELVEGMPIHAYLANKPDLHRLLQLFDHICQAVAFAHRHLIVHRDLKPANILVTKHGHPKLLDFGIAKLMNVSATQHAMTTLAHQQVFTPEYASPEQWQGQPVGTASDIYSLGTLLYRLLTGRCPFSVTNGNLAFLKEAVIHHTPPPVSQAMTCDKSTMGSMKSSRDLDCILQQTLRKNPNDRYATVEALREDLIRLQENRPVHARRASTAYIIQKLVRRHRGKFLAMAMATALLLSTAWVWFSQRREVLAEQTRVDRLNSVVADIFRLGDPVAQYREPLTMQQVLNKAEIALQDLQHIEPKRVLGYYRTLILAHLNLGNTKQAKTLIAEMTRLHQEKYGPDHPLTLNAWAEFAQVLYQRKEFNEARRLGRSILNRSGLHWDDLTRSPQRISQAHPAVLKAYFVLAGCHLHNNEFGTAWSAYKALLALESPLKIREPFWRIEALNGMGLVSYRQGNHARAEQLGQQAVALANTTLQTHPFQTLNVRNNLAITYRRMGNYQKAKALFDSNLALLQALKIENGQEAAFLHNNLGLLKRYLGQWAAADNHMEQALLMVVQQHGSQSLATARAQNNRALLHLDQAQWRQAERLLHQAITTRKAHLPPDHWMIAASYNNLALAAMGQAEWHVAEDMIHCAALVREKALAPGHPAILNHLRFQVMLDLSTNQLTHSGNTLAYILGCEETLWGLEPRHPAHSETLYLHGRYALKQGLYQTAYNAFADGLISVEARWPEHHYEVRRMVKGLRDACLALDNTSEAPYWQNRLANTAWLPSSALSYLTENHCPTTLATH